jgi:hypothetical protein
MKPTEDIKNKGVQQKDRKIKGCYPLVYRPIGSLPLANNVPFDISRRPEETKAK